MNDGPRIEVTEHGPFVVRGRVPLVRTSEVETPFHEPIGWAPGEPVPAPPLYRLCRCGGSATKPFCDDSHLTNGFDGTEVADRRPRTDRAATLEGDGVVVTDDPSLCAHAGFCANRRTHVWEMLADSDDPDVREELVGMVSLCPSGRLAHAPEPGAPEVEPAHEPSIAVVRDGPLWVRGGVEVRGADGEAYETRNRVTLCRCGRSANMPFCDGAHDDVGFRDG